MHVKCLEIVLATEELYVGFFFHFKHFYWSMKVKVSH